VVLVVVLLVVVVVVVGVHAGSAGFVQEQNVSPLILHCSTTDFLQALKSAPVKAPHAELISSEQVFGVHGFCALATEGTQMPAPSATAANVTTALLIIVILDPLKAARTADIRVCTMVPPFSICPVDAW
jgi:hypothetical protein